MTGKYHLAKVKPTIDVLPNQAFGAGDVLFDWYAFEIPRGVCKLTTLNVIVPGTEAPSCLKIKPLFNRPLSANAEVDRPNLNAIFYRFI